MSDIKIKGIARIEPVVHNGAIIFASFDADVGGVEVGGISLARYIRHGKISVFAPRVEKKYNSTGRARYVRFSEEARSALAEAATNGYVAMGGEIPEVEQKPKRQFIPLHELDLSEDEGIPLLRRISDALDDETERRGVPCFTEAYGLSTADFKDAAQYAADGHDDADDTEGLHRVLGVDPVVAAECDRAGL
jgi:hypothetical protein